ncbi:unnamed protein product [Heterobilharzia americana]|nr:unnamed protein product [Heterobilharzia americana]
MLRFEACDCGVPKRCASSIWVQLVVDPNEFPHLIQLSHLTNYLNPSLVNSNHDKLNKPLHLINQPIEPIERSERAMLSGYLTSDLNNNNNNRHFHENDNSANSIDMNNHYSQTASKYKNLWHVKSSSLDHRQHEEQVRNQYSSLHNQQLFEHKFRKSSSLKPSEHNENYMNHDNNNLSNNFVISEVAIVCLVIVFVILLIAIMVMIYLTRRKTFLFPVTNSKIKLKGGNVKSHPNGNVTNNETLCSPIELSENASSFYRTMPESMMNNRCL